MLVLICCCFLILFCDFISPMVFTIQLTLCGRSWTVEFSRTTTALTKQSALPLTRAPAPASVQLSVDFPKKEISPLSKKTAPYTQTNSSLPQIVFSISGAEKRTVALRPCAALPCRRQNALPCRSQNALPCRRQNALPCRRQNAQPHKKCLQSFGFLQNVVLMMVSLNKIGCLVQVKNPQDHPGFTYDYPGSSQHTFPFSY